MLQRFSFSFVYASILNDSIDKGQHLFGALRIRRAQFSSKKKRRKSRLHPSKQMAQPGGNVPARRTARWALLKMFPLILRGGEA
jgi:hypothetical protein